MRIILIGIQGAGKSTQGNLLSEKLGIPYLSTGHIFRELAKEKDPQGRYIKEVMTAGYLISDERTLEIVTQYLHRPEYKDGYVLDGFPRTLTQAEAFENGIDKVIYLKVSDREALWRLSYRESGERQDETLAAIRKRIEQFNDLTKPVLDYYIDKEKLIEINGESSVEKVFQDILKSIS